jgi:nucleoside phosphorylase/tetratricopeptide (TPR) repeat protein
MLPHGEREHFVFRASTRRVEPQVSPRRASCYLVTMGSASEDRERAEALAKRVTVGIVTALPKEHVAVKAMLDGPVDHDDYVLGEMPAKGGGTHVVALLRTGMGTTLAATKTAKLLAKIETIDAILMVGIAGGVPNTAVPWDHVRLGDIVVSDQRGVIDYGHVSETRQDGKVTTEHRNPPRAPSPRLLDAVDDLIGGEHEGQRPWLDLIRRGAHLKNSARPGEETDLLLGGELHPADDERREGEPRIFHGPIASSSVLLKDPEKRDALLARFGVRAVEMEGAGIADAAWDGEVGYLVVRGICDYCDEIKGYLWQEYAAIIAAAYARAVLGRMLSRNPGPREIESEPPKSAPPTPNNLTARNRDFRGRGEELAALDETLRHETRTTITHASVFGLGGIGKSALALEYAHRAVERGEYPGGVWWLHAEGKPVDALVNLAPVLRRHATAEVQKLLAGEETRAEAIADAVRLALQAQRVRSLLVLDNVSEPGWRPHLPEGAVRVLVTTRDEALAEGSSRRLEVLPATQAREVADAIAGAPRGQAEASAQQHVLAVELGGLAVAVAMAARAVKTWFRGSWIAYERVLREEEEMDAVLTDPKLVGEYGRGVFAAIDLSIDRCDADALALLEGAAVFAPDGVPLAWALAAAGLASEGAKARATAAVKELGVVTLDDESSTMSLHRLVHRQVRSRSERTEREDDWREVRRRAADAAARWLKGAVVLSQTRAEMEAVDARREHLDAALDAADRVDRQLAWIAIADRLATHLQNRARNDEALTLYQEALARAEQLVPPDLAQVALILSNLAIVLKYLGDAAGAKPLLERALGIDEMTFGPEHPRIAAELSALAMVLRDLGDVAGAKPLLERALGITEATFGPGDSRVATVLSNLAMMLSDLGDAAGAKRLVERALGIDEMTFGPEHPNVAVRLSNLATVLGDLGDVAGAKPLLERALGINEATFGTDHPIVATVLSNLALMLNELGDAAGAKRLLERALAIVEAHLPPGHPRQRLYRDALAIVSANLPTRP